ncbi:hypothetical protein IFM89_001241 [Coptis chinensis]|uniref:Uncharacterized protein n=1 Tax=Coptis chinensis TaxID=261450 RepID=A0A835H0M9_9MAGN|nr:hypothetical protein IFM89_001241 [Coptis chinensis]
MEIKFFVATIFIFCLVLSPALPSDAARFNQRELLQRRPICPACLCCPNAKTPVGSCCPCCRGPIQGPIQVSANSP